MKKKAIIGIIVVVILIVGLSIFASNPIISCKFDVPENYLEAIESQSKGQKRLGNNHLGLLIRFGISKGR